MTPTAARAVSVQSDRVRTPVAAERLQTLALETLRALRVRAAMLSITMVSSRRIAQLNRIHLGHRGATDVITFSLAPSGDNAIVGDIYICPDVARLQARAHGVGVREELARLVIHGTLHACGWDHPVVGDREGSRMWRRQEQLLRRLWIVSHARA